MKVIINADGRTCQQIFDCEGNPCKALQLGLVCHCVENFYDNNPKHFSVVMQNRWDSKGKIIPKVWPKPGSIRDAVIVDDKSVEIVNGKAVIK